MGTGRLFIHSRMHGYNHIATTCAILHNSNFGRQKVVPSCIVQVQKLCFVVSAVASSTERKANTVNLDDLEHALVTAKDCINNETISLKQQLLAHNMPKLPAISKQLSVKLSGVVRKADIVERLVCMPQWVFACPSDEVDGEDLSGLSYLTPTSNCCHNGTKCV